MDGGDKDLILNWAQQIETKNDDKFDSFLIVHKGKLLFESYYLRGRIDLPHFQGLGNKSLHRFGTWACYTDGISDYGRFGINPWSVF